MQRSYQEIFFRFRETISSIEGDGTDAFRKFQGVFRWFLTTWIFERFFFPFRDFRAVFDNFNFTASFSCDGTNAFRKIQDF